MYGAGRALVAGPFGGNQDATFFDGTTQVVDLPTTGFDPTSMTVEMWFKPQPGGDKVQRLIRQREWGFNLDWTRDERQVFAGAHLSNADGTYWGQVTAESGVLSNDEWHHVAMTLEPTRLILYVNGEEVDRFEAPTASAIRYGSDGLTVANDYSGRSNREFRGAIDELTFYDRHLAAAEVESHFVASGRTIDPAPPVVANDAYKEAIVAAGPTAYWLLDEADRVLTLDDEMGNHNAVNGYSSYNMEWEIDGAYPGSRGVRMNNGQEIATLPSTAIPDNEFTVEMWVRPDGTGPDFQRTIAARNYGFAVDWDNTTQTVNAWAYVGGNDYVSLTSAPLSTEQWHHVAFTLSFSTSTLIVNGAVEAEQVNPTSEGLLSGGSFVLGNESFGNRNRHFVGSIDDVAIYHRALAVSEIQGHYEVVGLPVQVDVSTDSALTCFRNGGNVFFPNPTFVPSENDFRDGCLDYQQCDGAQAWGASVIGISAMAEWSCGHNSELLSILDAIGQPFEAVINPSEGLGGFIVGGPNQFALVAGPPVAGVAAPAGTATATLLEAGTEVAPGPQKTSWARAGAYAFAVSGVAYWASEWLEPQSVQGQTAVLGQVTIIDDIAELIPPDPFEDPEEDKAKRKTMSLECIDEIDLVAAAATIGEALTAGGMTAAGKHACELVNVFFPAGHWTTQTGNVRITLESTLQNAAAIAGPSPAVLDRRLPAHLRTWIPVLSTCTSVGTGKDCDEYPYASSDQGGATNFGLGTVRVDLIDRDSNQGEGNALASFYPSCGIPPNGGQYSDSTYFVVPIPIAEVRTTWICKP